MQYNENNNPTTITSNTITTDLVNSRKKKRESAIVACCIVSESEVVMAVPDYTSSYEQDKPEVLSKVLFDFGMDVSQEYKRQDGLQHRNKVNEVVTCSRWVGNERTDQSWISSGYASKEAIDKHTGSKILEDLYRERGCTQDIQDYLNERDVHDVIDESVWI
jgi:hypothetical protein